MKTYQGITIVAVAALLLASCSNPHFFPRLRPLFPGLEEANVPADSRSALAEAKEDFQLARHGEAPQYAQFTSFIPYTSSKVFEGHGYRLTMVDKADPSAKRIMGPEIVVNSNITGGKAYRYDEVDFGTKPYR